MDRAEDVFLDAQRLGQRIAPLVVALLQVQRAPDHRHRRRGAIAVAAATTSG